MMNQNAGTRPPIATFFGAVSLLWALVMLGWVLVVIGFAVAVGAASWLGGPVIGFVGTFIGVVLALYCILSSLLSFVLLWAGWLILRGNPRGVPLLRLWAWISLLFDTLTLLFSGGAAPTSWGALLYAVAVLYFTRTQELDRRWVVADGPNPDQTKPKFTGDPDF